MGQGKTTTHLVGYAALGMGILTAAGSVLASYSEEQLKVIAAGSARKEKDDALAFQAGTIKRLQQQYDILQHAERALQDANMAQKTALNVALRQFPVD